MNDRDIFMNAPEGGSPEELARYIDEQCGDDLDLRASVEALFAAKTQAGTDFLDAGIAAESGLFDTPTPGSASGSESLKEPVGTVIGDYRLGEMIGSGGFGQVYLADQLRPVERRVALKIVKVGMDTKQFVDRFKAEQQSLAIMEHPNIAKVFDAGVTDTGRPYFVMEYVDGAPISTFCDRHELGIETRLKVFIDVCHGVQHAHLKGIIHRDLKPANVLVGMHDGKPVPRVIDFGIAKAIGSAPSDSTLAHGSFCSPPYMSPEQAAAGEVDIDTRSDVYSLGVILYELLSGKSPYEPLPRDPYKQGNEVRKQIERESITKPSARVSALSDEEREKLATKRKIDPRKLGRSLRGDLDWITMKALEKNRERRYESANSLLAEVERFLANEPVSASQPTTYYRVGKFVRRHPVGVAACALLIALVGLVSGLGLWAAHQKSLASLDRLLKLESEIQLMPLSPIAGRKEKGLTAVREAAQMRQSLDIRDGAIRNLAQMDISSEPVLEWEGFPRGTRDLLDFDSGLENYVTCDVGGIVSLRESGTGREQSKLPTPVTDIDRLELSASGNLVAIWSKAESGGILKVWDFRSSKMVFDKRVSHGAGAFDFSADEKWIAFCPATPDPDPAPDKKVRSVEVRNLERPEDSFRPAIPDRKPHRLRFQPGGNLLAIESEESLYLHVVNWRTEDYSGAFFSAHISDFAWHPDGNLLCVAPKGSPLYLCPQRPNGGFWDTVSLGPGTVGENRVAFSSDGSFLVTANLEDELKLRDPSSGAEFVKLVMGSGERVEHLAVGPENRQLAWTRSGSEVKIWGIEPDECVYSFSSTMTLQRRPTAVRFDATGRVLFVTNDRGVGIWDWKNRRYAGILELGPVESVEWTSSTNNLLISGGSGGMGGMRINLFWEGVHLSSGALRLFDAPPPRSGHMNFGANEGLVSFEVDQTIRIFRPDVYRHHAELSTGSEFAASALNPRAEEIAVLDKTRQRLKIYSIGANGDPSEIYSIGEDDLLAETDVPGGESLNFTPDGQRLIVGTSNEYRIFERSGKSIRTVETFPVSAQRRESSVAVTPDGRYAAWNESRSKVAIIDLDELEVVAHLPLRDNEPATSLAFSPSSRELAIANGGLSVEVWDLALLNQQLSDYDLEWDKTHGYEDSQAQEFSWSGRGNIFENRNRDYFVKSEEDISGLRTRDDSQAAEERGIAFRKLREFELAEMAFTEALEGNPGARNLLDLRVDCYRRQGKAVQAVTGWEKILEQEASYESAILGLAGMYLLGPEEVLDVAKGREKCALLAENQNLDQGFLYFSYFFQAAADYHDGKISNALTKLETSVKNGHEKRFTMCAPFYLKAMCLFKKGDRFAAERAFAEGTRRWNKDPALSARNALYVPLRQRASELLGHTGDQGTD